MAIWERCRSTTLSASSRTRSPRGPCEGLTTGAPAWATGARRTNTDPLGPAALDVVHRVAGAARLLGQVGEVDLVEHFALGLGDWLPGAPQDARRGSVVGGAGALLGRRPFDDRHYVEQGDLLRRLGQLIAAAGAPGAGDQTGSLELEQDLHQKPRRNAVRVGDPLDPDRLARLVVQRQFQDRDAGVFGFGADVHVDISYRGGQASLWGSLRVVTIDGDAVCAKASPCLPGGPYTAGARSSKIASTILLST